MMMDALLMQLEKKSNQLFHHYVRVKLQWEQIWMFMH